MAAPERANMKQKAVLWPITGYDPNGNIEVSDPQEIKVRWEETDKEIVQSDQAPITGNATIYYSAPIAEGSKLWLGALADLPTNPNQFIVINCEDTPDIKGRKHQYTITAYLQY